MDLEGLMFLGYKRASTVDGQEDNADDDDSRPKKKPHAAKRYVPSYRSGAYALIFALSSLPRDSLQSLTKADLVEMAQPHCESSFTVPSEAGKFYTAWNSMNTLVAKFLVHERGRPTRRYTLTDEGWELADKMRAAQKGKKDKSEEKQKSAKVDKPRRRVARSESPQSNEFVDLEEDSDEAPQPLILPKPRPDRNPSFSRSVSPQRVSKQAADFRDKKKINKSKTPEPPDGFIDLLSSPETHHARIEKPRGTRETVLDPKPSGLNTHRGNSTVTTTHGRNDSQEVPTFTPITIPAGSFTVRLVLDSREIQSKCRRTHIKDELVKLGIDPIQRALELGDFFWVAKLHDPLFLSQHGEEGDEIALDWIVERKRLDDLVASITDGRFQEQKFRLQRCGAQHVVYLIENFTLDTKTQENFHDKVQSAIASTQVINEFCVKKTYEIAETIRYIARLTTTLKSLYEPHALSVIPTRVLTAANQTALLESREHHLTYPTFATLSSKSDALTLRDVFLKMLMCTRGISGEKALAMQKVWPTPRALVEAYERCAAAAPKERDGLVDRGMEKVVGRSRVKGVLSAKVAAIWGAEAAG